MEIGMKKHCRLVTGLFLIAAVLGGILTFRPVDTMASPGAVVSHAGTRAQDKGAKTDSDVMEVHFLDVGQGDSTLITCGEHAMLIDAGDDSKGTTIWNYLKKQKVEKLDYLVLTHPDSDHIGGAPVIITKFQIDKVFVSNFEKDTKTYLKLIQSLDNKRLKYTTPKAGTQYSLGSATITILAPNDEYDNPNDASVALLVENGENRFLFTGDAGEDAEQDMTQNGLSLAADVYKVGHHGSRTATSEDFFEAVNPSCAVISCGEGNSYGHPHAQTLNTLRANGVKVYRTDEDGVIIATSDGKDITFNVPASQSWKAGEPTANAGTASSGVRQDQGASTQDNGQVQNQKTEPAAQTAPQVQTQETSGAAQAQNGSQESPGTDQSLQEPRDADSQALTYVLNVKTKKFHLPSCSSLPTTNRQDSTQSRETILSQGYDPCKRCNP